ncbi:hypothetical protein [Halomonas sp. M4R1S46]|uniref:hypothetical protein n=1 Tax=Halomonas sp. M4R1S46 TaxID=2982692 RepID=UPI0021E4BE55|nr:hypothetical protein [Halomonas sp. M4R1S46]UYG06770.1 hypothetical protein OCT48_14220 [Halomonas sp. M4R1S46]
MKTLTLRSMLLAIALLFGSGVAIAEGTDKFTELDANGDGALSAEEATDVTGLDFEAADADGDGALSEEEFKAAKTSMEGGDEGTGMEGETMAE